MSFDITILIISIIVTLIILFQFFNATPLEKSCVYLFSGRMGSGKSYLSVQIAVKQYKKAIFNWFIRSKLLHKKEDKPILLSLLPIGRYKTKKVKGKKIITFTKISVDLKKEHLLQQIFIPLGSTILLEEGGTILNQWDYDTEECITVGKLTRFYRQWIGGKHGVFIVNDQASSEIVKAIRVRCGNVYNMKNFRRWAKILPFYKVNYQSLLISDDQVSNQGTTDLQSRSFGIRKQNELLPYLFGFMPYKFMKRNYYNTYAYRTLYYDMFGIDLADKGDMVHELIEMPRTKLKRK